MKLGYFLLFKNSSTFEFRFLLLLYKHRQSVVAQLQQEYQDLIP